MLGSKRSWTAQDDVAQEMGTFTLAYLAVTCLPAGTEPQLTTLRNRVVVVMCNYVTTGHTPLEVARGSNDHKLSFPNMISVQFMLKTYLPLRKDLHASSLRSRWHLSALPPNPFSVAYFKISAPPPQLHQQTHLPPPPPHRRQ